ncbi:MAG: TerB family tellurite resistance protein [Prevotella sp.]|nr:TerB family tellurite resistance protein [Prevotella sp.]
MSIVDWFTNDMSTEERTLTRDLLSVAVADKEFTYNEKQVILETCVLEDISHTELMDSIRDSKAGAKVLQSQEEKKRYLIHLIRMMAADGKFPSIELHVIEIIAKRIGITPIQILSFVLDEINENNIGQEEGLVIIDKFVRHLIVTGA